jgi:hypothetical protein
MQSTQVKAQMQKTMIRQVGFIVKVKRGLQVFC